MGFLKDSMNQEDSDEPGADLEEQYERLFPKIGRDFVHKDDLEKMLRLIMFLLDPLGLNPLNSQDDSEARKKANQYKNVLESGKDGSKLFKDLIKLDND
jgi:hypothetical protein